MTERCVVLYAVFGLSEDVLSVYLIGLVRGEETRLSR